MSLMLSYYCIDQEVSHQQSFNMNTKRHANSRKPLSIEHPAYWLCPAHMDSLSNVSWSKQFPSFIHPSSLFPLLQDTSDSTCLLPAHFWHTTSACLLYWMIVTWMMLFLFLFTGQDIESDECMNGQVGWLCLVDLLGVQLQVRYHIDSKQTIPFFLLSNLAAITLSSTWNAFHTGISDIPPPPWHAKDRNALCTLSHMTISFLYSTCPLTFGFIVI